MLKKSVAVLLCIAFVAAFAAGCAPVPHGDGGAEGLVARVDGRKFLVRGGDGEYSEAFLNGIDIGAAKAGYFPGEFGIEKQDYLRWFKQISDMNIHVIRVYVTQMPCFYEALLEYNRKAREPLYLMHGVYVNESMVVDYNDAYGGEGALKELFENDIRNATDVIHGNAQIERLRGNAGGEYRADVSQWVIGWILGIEWPSEFVVGTNEAHPNKTSFNGRYVKTVNASPFEVFLADVAETAISYEMEHYSNQRPVALSNWPTTDPLEHPNEPTPIVEDGVSIDTEHIIATGEFEAGFFASYHIYPYYPDFLSYDTKYLGDNNSNPYLAYITELSAYHTVPVIISEYGIPTSRGIAHQNVVTGMSQGHAEEKLQAEWIISMNKDIKKSGCAGAFIFSWQDEWFKRTWNSVDYEDRERLPYWLNVQSPEERFGLMTFEPGEKDTVVKLDGKDSEWKKKELVAENDGIRVYAKSDAAYLYLLVKSDDFDFENGTLYLPIDVIENQGNSEYNGMSFSDGADFLLRLNGKDNSAVLVDSYYDSFQYSYSVQTSFFEIVPEQLTKNSGCFNPIYLAMNRPLHMPETGVTTEFERFDTGKLRYGNGDQKSADYNSQSDFFAGADFVEIRLPWMLLGFMDPSTKEVVSDFNVKQAIVPEFTDGVKIGVCRAEGRGNVPMNLYSWDNWDIPETHERLKQSYYILKDYFGGAN